MQISLLLTSALATIAAAQTYRKPCPAGAAQLGDPHGENGVCCVINVNNDRYGGDIEGQRFRVGTNRDCYIKCGQYKGPAGSIIERCVSAVWVRNDSGDNCFLKYYREPLRRNTAIDAADCEPCKWRFNPDTGYYQCDMKS